MDRKMDSKYFLVTAWNNGNWNRTGAGYGLKISVESRDRYFLKNWNTVTLQLIGDRTSRTAEVNVAKRSFWSQKCRELIKIEIGQWLIENNFALWCRGTPPKFRMVRVGDRKFEVRPHRR